jgi:hypothetical protein
MGWEPTGPKPAPGLAALVTIAGSEQKHIDAEDTAHAVETPPGGDAASASRGVPAISPSIGSTRRQVIPTSGHAAYNRDDSAAFPQNRAIQILPRNTAGNYRSILIPTGPGTPDAGLAETDDVKKCEGRLIDASSPTPNRARAASTRSPPPSAESLAKFRLQLPVRRPHRPVRRYHNR